MKMLIKIMFTFMLLLSLLGCTKESNSPEDIGKAHFELYFDVLLGEEVDVDHECKEIYSVDSSLLEEDDTLYVVQIEGNYKAVLRTND